MVSKEPYNKIPYSKFLIIPILVILISMFSFLPQDAHAATVTWVGAGDGVHWSDPLNWNTGTLPASTDNIVIDGNSSVSSTVHLDIAFDLTGSLTINQGDTLENDAPTSLIDDGTVENFGILRTLHPFINHGNLINHISGTIDAHDSFENGRAGVFTNYGMFLVDAAVINFGTLNNAGGTINNLHSDWDIENWVGGTIINSGIIVNSGSFLNKAGGSMNIRSGLMNNTAGSIYDNYGTLNVDTSTITNSGKLNNHVSGKLIINSKGMVNNNLLGKISNSGNLTNAGTIKIVSSTHLTNSGGSINNNAGGKFTIFGIVTNSGSINNNAGTMDNSGKINNNSGGTINNNSSGTISNSGAINNCNNINNLGIITGNPINNTCTYMQDTTASYGLSVYSGRQIHAEWVSNTSSLVGNQMDTIMVQLKKVGSPTGTASIGVFNTDLSIKKTFGTIDVSTLTTSYKNYKFALTIPHSYQIQAGDRIGIKFAGGNASTNYIVIMTDQNDTDPFDGINSYLMYYTTAWQNYPTKDIYMILKGNGTIN